MKTKALLTISVLVMLMLASCNGNKSNNTDAWVAENHEPVLRQLPDYYLEDSATVGGHLYTYEITREPSDSLPRVQDDMGDLYADNIICLTLRRDGNMYFKKRFTKATFASSIEENFYKNAILDGIRFIRGEAGQGLTFSFAVSYPDSDMSMPFLLTVTDGGSFSFVKNDNLDMMEGDSTYYDNDGV